MYTVGKTGIDTNYLYQDTSAQLDQLNQPNQLLESLLHTDFAFDIESTGTDLSTSIPLGYSLSPDPSIVYYTTIDDPLFHHIVSSNTGLKIAHNASFDRSMLKKAGIIIDNLACTMVAAHLLQQTRLSLKALSVDYLSYDIASYSDLTKPISDMDIDELLAYSGPHSVVTLMLWSVFVKELNKYALSKVFWNIEMPIVPVISDLELTGVGIDTDVLKSIGVEIDGKLESITSALDYWSDMSDMNHNSPDQLADLLYNKLKLPPGQITKSGKRPGVGAEYLETLKDRHPYISLYLTYKQLKTLKNSYVNSLLRSEHNGRIYCSFNQAGTRTGRLSSSKPNLQKIPARTELGKRIRTAFIPQPGYSILRADYDQLELRMMACCSGEDFLINAFREGKDVHLETAIRAYNDPSRRFDGKTLNFTIIYGGGDEKMRKKLFGLYPKILAWTKKTIAECQEAGYARTPFGRLRLIDEFNSPSFKMREHAGRAAISTIVQGGSAEIVKIGMRRAWNELRDRNDVRMLIQVHDELVFEIEDSIIHDVAQVLVNTMTYNELDIPFTISISKGKSWGELEDYNVGKV